MNRPQNRLFKVLLYSVLGVMSLALIAVCAAAFQSERFRAVTAMERHGAYVDTFDRYSFPKCGIGKLDWILYRVDLALRLLRPVGILQIDDATSEDLRSLAYFPELRRLHLVSGDFDADALRVMREFSALEVLEIHGNSAIDENALDCLRHCAVLRRLSLIGDGEIHGEFLDELTCADHLRELEIWATPDFNDEDLWRLRRFKHLESVDISFGAFSGDGFAVFAELPALKTLRISIPNPEVRMFLSGIPEVIDGD